MGNKKIGGFKSTKKLKLPSFSPDVIKSKHLWEALEYLEQFFEKVRLDDREKAKKAPLGTLDNVEFLNVDSDVAVESMVEGLRIGYYGADHCSDNPISTKPRVTSKCEIPFKQSLPKGHISNGQGCSQVFQMCSPNSLIEPYVQNSFFHRGGSKQPGMTELK